jgi:hypothetical protein
VARLYHSEVEDRRPAFVVWTGAVCTASATLAGFFRHVDWLFITAIAVSCLAFVALIVTGISTVTDWINERVSGVKAKRRRRRPTFTSLWRTTTEGVEVPGLMMTLQKELSHPGYSSAVFGQRSQSVRIGVLTACAPLEDSPSTTELRDAFLRFLRSQPIRDLTRALTAVTDGLSWHTYVSNGRLTNGAVLTRTPEQTEAPVVSAILNLNEISTSGRWGLDPRYAELLLHIQPRDSTNDSAQPRDLEHWFDVLVLALALPAAFSSFLKEDLGLATYDDPSTQVGVRIDGYPDLAVLVDSGAFQPIPGSAITNSFPSYMIASPGGKTPARAVADTLRLWCDHALHVGGYEAELKRLTNR